MKKLAVRLLMFSMLATSLLVVPVVTPAGAATTSSKHMKKKQVRAVHQSPKVANPSASPFGSRYEDDPDRKAAGGGY